MKKIITSVLILIFIALLIKLCFFLGLFGRFGLVYMPLLHQDHLADPKSISSIYSGNINDIILSHNSLKYCTEIKELDIYLKQPYRNTDFLRDFTKLENLGMEGHFNDWSGLQYCTDLTIIYFSSSNFSDFKYLKDLHSLKAIEIGSDSPLKYSDGLSFPELETIEIEAPEFDISCVKSAETAWFMSIEAEKIYHYSDLENLKALEKFGLINTSISKDDLDIISGMSNIEKIVFINCRLDTTSEYFNEIFSDRLISENAIETKDCIFKN